MSNHRTRVEDTYEAQNDQHLNELHGKLRTLRGVTTDIYEDVERQNLTLDETGNHFSSFGSSLAHSTQRASHAFGLGKAMKHWRVGMYCTMLFIAVYIILKFLFWWWPATPAPAPARP